MKNEMVAIGIVSALLFLYCMFAALNVLLDWALLIVGLSPIFIIWMVWVVLKHGVYKGPELEPDQEFGYLNK